MVRMGNKMVWEFHTLQETLPQHTWWKKQTALIYIVYQSQCFFLKNVYWYQVNNLKYKITTDSYNYFQPGLLRTKDMKTLTPVLPFCFVTKYLGQTKRTRFVFACHIALLIYSLCDWATLPSPFHGWWQFPPQYKVRAVTFNNNGYRGKCRLLT